MTVQGGFGVPLRINTGSLTTVVSLLDVDFPVFKSFIAESTGHDAPSGYYQATPSGKKRLQPFRAKIGWDTAEATHAQFVTSFDANTIVGFDIADPDGDELIAFNAYVEEIGRMSPQEGIFEADVLIHPSGAPTIT